MAPLPGGSRRLLRVLACALLLTPSALPGQEPGPRPRPLFESDSVLALTLRTDLRTVIRDRDTLESRYHPATLSYVGPEGGPRSLDVEVKTRGHFRLRTCGFPPLRVKFGAGVEGSVFAGEEKLKLVTPCERQGERYEQFILQEYLLYRIYRLFTPYSFRVRLARITYEDTRGRMPAFTRHSFFLESEDGLAERNGGYIMDVQGARREHLQAQETALLALFQFLIANTDWSIAGLHNIRLLQTQTNVVYPVPYDLDWSGVIATPYAAPDPSLPIRSVRERLYRGHCVPVDELQPAVAEFLAKRDAIYALLDSVPALEPSRANSMRRSFDSFFKIVQNPGALAREIPRSCLGGK